MPVFFVAYRGEVRGPSCALSQVSVFRQACDCPMTTAGACAWAPLLPALAQSVGLSAETLTDGGVHSLGRFLYRFHLDAKRSVSVNTCFFPVDSDAKMRLAGNLSFFLDAKKSV